MGNHVRLFYPNGLIKNVIGDEFCVIRAFQEGLSICYNEHNKLCDVKQLCDQEYSEILMNILHFLVIKSMY